MSLVKLQVRAKQKKGRQWMDGDSEDGVRLASYVPIITYIVAELPYSIFQIPVHFSASSLTYEMLR